MRARRRLRHAQSDAANDADCKNIIAVAERKFGGLDILVNKRWYHAQSLIRHDDLDAAVTDDVWQRIMDVNVKGPFQCIRAAAFAGKSDVAHVVNVASGVCGIAATGSSVPYAASKAALINTTISLARKCWPPKICLNHVGGLHCAKRWRGRGSGRSTTVNRSKRPNRGCPLKRVSTPEDVADGIVESADRLAADDRPGAGRRRRDVLIARRVF